MDQNVLHLVYPPKNIYIVGYTFDDENRGVRVTCKVPTGISYGLRSVPYVTAENYVRCLSQTSFLLVEHLLDAKLLELDLAVDAFRKAATEYLLYYRNLNMTFHARVAPGDEFEMRLTLKNWRQIRRFHDFILFTFTNERTVIGGEMSFVFQGTSQTD